MRTPKRKTILVVYGEGGHKAQMQRLLDLSKLDELHSIIAITESGTTVLNQVSETYFLKPLRHKSSHLKTSIYAVMSIVGGVRILLKAFLMYDIRVVISTGPGLALAPLFVASLLRKKTIFIEDWCRFKSRSIAGRIAYHIVDIFLIQNFSLQRLYPKAKFCGLLL